MMSKFLGTYVNGNTIVAMYDDGTKERYIKDGEKAAPEFPESIDLKITNCCNLGCPMCAERSVPGGKHADLSHPMLNTIKPYTELAIGGGNPLEHPDLVEFLRRMQKHRVICNITVNATHFMNNSGLIGNLAEHGLIHGIGVSVPNNIPDGLILMLEQYPNAVIHTIVGYTPVEVFDRLAGHNLNLLILGYKAKGKGFDQWQKHREEYARQALLLTMNLDRYRKQFKAIAFDNLAIKQLAVEKWISKEEYDNLYMGDDGQFTMYIDLVDGRFGKSSTHYLHPIDFDMAPAVGDLFLELKE